MSEPLPPMTTRPSTPRTYERLRRPGPARRLAEPGAAGRAQHRPALAPQQSRPALAEERAGPGHQLHAPTVEQPLVAVAHAEEPHPARRAGLGRCPERGVHPRAVPSRGEDRQGGHGADSATARVGATMTSLMMRGAVVTGANRGIGKAIALAFLRAGWPVIAVVRTAESVAALRREAGDHAPRCRWPPPISPTSHRSRPSAPAARCPRPRAGGAGQQRRHRALGAAARHLHRRPPASAGDQHRRPLPPLPGAGPGDGAGGRGPGDQHRLHRLAEGHSLHLGVLRLEARPARASPAPWRSSGRPRASP